MLPLHILLSLAKVNSLDLKKIARAGYLGLLVALAVYAYLQHVALEKAELAYHNPRQTVRVQKIVVQGPTRIVTRVVEVEGRKETTTEEVRGPVFEAMDRAFLTEPVFPPAPRQDRWLVGASLNPFHTGRPDQWTALAGYSFRNRVDLCAGATMTGSPRLLVMLRF